MVYCPWSRSWWCLECKFSARRRYVSVSDLVPLLRTRLPTSGRLCFRLFLTSVLKAAKFFLFRSAQLIIKNVSVKAMVILFSLIHVFPFVFLFLLFSSLLSSLENDSLLPVEGFRFFISFWALLTDRSWKEETNFPVLWQSGEESAIGEIIHERKGVLCPFKNELSCF